jgi:hypothetical protein
VSNFVVYWVSYVLWAALSLTAVIKTSGESRIHKKGPPWVFGLIIIFFALLALVGRYPILNNVMASWAGGFMLGLAIGAVAYLVKPSLNFVEPDRREGRRCEMLRELTIGSSGEKTIAVISEARELRGPTGKMYDLFLTDRRIIGIRRIDPSGVNKIHVESTDSNALE